MPVWWDDTLRKVSCCWKDQRKFKKQFKADNKSIRYNSYDDENYNIDACKNIKKRNRSKNYWEISKRL